MKALTLHQPYASLIAVGAKTIETRGWSTRYRGPLVIHASKAKPPVEMMEDGLAGEMGDVDGRWFQWCQGEDAPALSDWYLYDCTSHGGPTPTPGAQWVMPLGAVVASCRLVDVVPIGGPTSFSTGIVDGEECPTAGRDVIVHHPPMGEWPPEALMLDRWNGGVEDITDQLPFGDFTPGRYAWLLEDVAPTTERCPWSWGMASFCPDGNREHDLMMLGEHFDPLCPVCDGAGVCEPVAAKGRQGLWEWSPAAR